VPLDQANVDTDQIIPARFLAVRAAAGPRRDVPRLALRRADGSRQRPDFVLNQPQYAGCADHRGRPQLRLRLVARAAPSRVMVDNGFRAFIAPSFGDIFFNNCFQNGVLPIRLPAERVEALRAALRATPGSELTVDLERQTVTGPDGSSDPFEIDSFRKDCLLKGVDEVSLTLGYEADIVRFEARLRREMDWL
jgi:3-isopropylmalate/(R)-2-methylmalate dehydratase small subunit